MTIKEQRAIVYPNNYKCDWENTIETTKEKLENLKFFIITRIQFPFVMTYMLVKLAYYTIKDILYEIRRNRH